MYVEVTSLISRTHPWRGKRFWWLWAKTLVQLTTHGGIYLYQSECSFSTVVWLTNRRSVQAPLAIARHTNLNRPRSGLTGQSDLSFVYAYLYVACPEPARPSKQPRVTRPFSLLKFEGCHMGSGDETAKMAILKVCIDHNVFTPYRMLVRILPMLPLPFIRHRKAMPPISYMARTANLIQ